jgi:hypothetical protein
MYKEKLQISDVKVFAYARVGMNNRRLALLIDPTVDLAATQSTIWHAPWITPTNPNPLRRIEHKDKEPTLTLHGILLQMGLTEASDCIAGGTHPDLHEVAVCSPPSEGLWNSQW